MNPGASATLDFSSHLTEFRPVADDQFTKNDITVGRVSGSSYRVYAVSGEMSVLDPPDGVGQYADSISVNVLYDSQLADIAGWKLYWGTAPEMRHPVASIDMSRAG